MAVGAIVGRIVGIGMAPPKAAAAPTMAYNPGVILQNSFDSHIFWKNRLSWFLLKIN
jgi:hypothetical protein